MRASITSEQQKQYCRFVEDGGTKALEQVDLDKDGLQRLLGRGGEFQKVIVSAIRELSADVEREAQAFWEKVWEEILGRKVEIPPLSKLSGKTAEAVKKYGFRVMYLPTITEEDYPTDFVKPVWGKYLDESLIERKPLIPPLASGGITGQWVAVETIAKPHWDDPAGYGNDLLGKTLGFDSRFRKSWDELKSYLPKAGKLISAKEVRFLTVEEWNLVGNLFLWLNRHRGALLPDLGSTRSWEWCENAFGSESRLLVGLVGRGGLADVDGHWHVEASGTVGFRVLAVL